MSFKPEGVMHKLPLAISLVAFSISCSAGAASAATAQQCETRATNCLGNCAGIDSASSAYGRCVDKCDGARTACMDSASTGAKGTLTVNPGPGKPPKAGLPTTTGASPSGIKPATSSPPKAPVGTTTPSPTIAPQR